MCRSKIDSLANIVFGFSAVIATIVVFGIGFFLLLRSWPAVTDIGLSVLWDRNWNPASVDGQSSYGLGSMIAGSCLITLGAVLISAPVGIAISVFSQFFAITPVRVVVQQILVVAAAIPSVVYGFWGIVFLVPVLSSFAQPGTSLAAGVLLVSLMIIPTIAILCTKAFQEVPRSHVNAAVDLGLGRVTIVGRILFPIARKGIVIAVVMGVMRAIGETMAVVMVCGNIPQIPNSACQPVRTLTANIALEMGYALELHQSVLFLSAVFLLGVSLALVGWIHFLSERKASAI